MTIYLPKNTPGDFSTAGASSLLSKQLDNALKEHKKGSFLMYSEPKILTPFVEICKEFKFKYSVLSTSMFQRVWLVFTVV